MKSAVNLPKLLRQASLMVFSLAVMLLTIDKIFCASLVKSSSRALIFPILFIIAYILPSSALKVCVSCAERSLVILVVRTEISLNFLSPHGNDSYEYREKQRIRPKMAYFPKS